MARPNSDESIELTPEFVRLHGLTAQEARLLEFLVNGATPDEARLRFEISMATVRKHIQSIFRKTDTRRQVDLVRIVLLHPAQTRSSQHGR